jgi:hypothetical protein
MERLSLEPVKLGLFLLEGFETCKENGIIMNETMSNDTHPKHTDQNSTQQNATAI